MKQARAPAKGVWLTLSVLFGALLAIYGVLLFYLPTLQEGDSIMGVRDHVENVLNLRGDSFRGLSRLRSSYTEVAATSLSTVTRQGGSRVFSGEHIHSGVIDQLSYGTLILTDNQYERDNPTKPWVRVVFPLSMQGYMKKQHVSLVRPQSTRHRGLLISRDTASRNEPRRKAVRHVCHSVRDGSANERAFLGNKDTLVSCGAASFQKAEVSAQPTQKKSSSLRDVLVKLPSGSWLDQWPVGSDGFGALVGGGLHHEVVSLSKGGYYTQDRRAFEDNEQFWGDKSKVAGQRIAVRRMREGLMKGDLNQADAASKGVFNPRGARFEFLADLVLSATSVYHDDNTTSPDLRASRDAATRKVTAIHSGPRAGALQSFYSNLKGSAGATEIDDGADRAGIAWRRYLSAYDADGAGATGSRQVTDVSQEHVSSLDMVVGLASSSFVDRVVASDGSIGAEAIFHHRDWVSSAESEVLAGRYSCRSTLEKVSEVVDADADPAEPSGRACLSVTVQLGRESSGLQPRPLLSRRMTPVTLQDQGWDTLSTALVLSPTAQLVAPEAVVGVVVLCRRPSDAAEDDLSREQRDKRAAQGYLHCRSNEAILYAAAEVEDTGSLAYFRRKPAADAPATVRARLLRRVTARLHAAIEAGFYSVRRAHARRMRGLLSSSTLSLFPSLADAAAAASPAPARGQGEEEMVVPSVDAFRSSTALLQLGRYLSLSSSDGPTASNLQGIWADGHYSQWNGDYHLNINQQMLSWALSGVYGGSTGGTSSQNNQNSPRSQTEPTFARFIRRLRESSGRGVAALMYGDAAVLPEALNATDDMSPWVAHAFVDGLSVDAGVGADYHWALCSSCGAWTLLTLADYVLFSGVRVQQPGMDPDEAIDPTTELLHALGGVANFYLKYLSRDQDGLLHTGPTTSPENQYLVQTIDAQRQTTHAFHQLVMSPALDMSVLRNTAQTYETLLSVFQLSAGKKGRDAAVARARKRHEATSRALRQAVQQLPNEGQPRVDPATGLILEYPVHFGSSRRQLKLSGAQSNSTRASGRHTHIVDCPDAGHRHFSGLHWLYPGVYPPASAPAGCNSRSNPPEVCVAALKTMRHKRLQHGGHTSWSAVWEAALFARLGEGNSAWLALQRVLREYSTSRLMTLHPKLAPVPPSAGGLPLPGAANSRTMFRDPMYMYVCGLDGEQDCPVIDLPASQQQQQQLEQQRRAHQAKLDLTAAQETLGKGKHSRRNLQRNAQARGLLTDDGSAFQMDAQAGYSAAFGELLVQSHVPGRLHILAAMPGGHWPRAASWVASPTEGGAQQSSVQAATGLAARGAIDVDLRWAWHSTHASSPPPAATASLVLLRASVTVYQAHPWAAPTSPQLARSGITVLKIAVGSRGTPHEGGPLLLRTSFKTPRTPLNRATSCAALAAGAEATADELAVEVRDYPCVIVLSSTKGRARERERVKTEAELEDDEDSREMVGREKRAGQSPSFVGR